MARRRKRKGCLRRLLAVAILLAAAAAVVAYLRPDLPVPAPSFSEGAPAAVQHAASETDTRFDPEFRPAYAALSSDGQAAYRQLVNAILTDQARVDLDVELGEAEVQAVVTAIRADQPELFWLGDGQVWSRDGVVESVEFTFTATGDELARQRAELDERAEAITAGLAGRPVAEQEQAVLEAIAGAVTYDPTAPDAGQTAYNALVQGRAVCGGYARAFQLLMNELGVPCYYVSGQGEGGAENSSGDWGSHAWNLVKTDQGWYAVDPTWMQADLFGSAGLSYRWFNGTEAGFSATHRRGDESAPLPGTASAEYPLEEALGATGPVLTLESAGFSVEGTVSTVPEYTDLVVRSVSEGRTRAVFVATGDLASRLADARQTAANAAAQRLGRDLSLKAQTIQYDDNTLLVVEDYSAE